MLCAFCLLCFLSLPFIVVCFGSVFEAILKYLLISASNLYLRRGTKKLMGDFWHVGSTIDWLQFATIFLTITLNGHLPISIGRCFSMGRESIRTKFGCQCLGAEREWRFSVRTFLPFFSFIYSLHEEPSGLVLPEDEPVNFARLGMGRLSDSFHAVLLFSLLYLASACYGTWPPVWSLLVSAMQMGCFPLSVLLGFSFPALQSLLFFLEKRADTSGLLWSPLPFLVFFWAYMLSVFFTVISLDFWKVAEININLNININIELQSFIFNWLSMI